MRRLLLFFALLSPLPAWATFSPPTQAVFNNACAASSSCAVTVSAIGAGHLLVVLAHIGNTQTLTSVTAAGETFTVMPQGGGNPDNCEFNAGGNTTQFDCAYVLKSVGGATTVTCNWSGTASASNTSCGFYEVAFTAPRVFLETNAFNKTRGSASTFVGGDFSLNYLKFINGTNDIIFQAINVSTGTISAIDSPFVLDNHTGQVADAHILNTFSNTPPTWTNSVAATATVSALSFGEDYNPNTAGTIPATTPNNGLRLSYSGSAPTRIVTVTAPGQFDLAFEEGDAWGIAQWHDLVNDPGGTTNLLGPIYGSGSADLTSAEPGLFNRTYYDFTDTKQFCRSAQYYFPNLPRQLSILEYTPNRIVIETKSEPTVTAQRVLNNMIGTARYYIYSNGQIYVHFVSTVTNAATINPANLFSDMTLEDPTQLGTNPPDTQGWIRASSTQNPYTGVAGAETYLFAYWGSATPAPYTTYTKASILMVRNPNNTHDGDQIIHSWASVPGYGVIRWGWKNGAADTISLGAGGTEVEDVLIQLGTQGSTVLPNITSSAVAGPIATAYIANPTPPTLAPGIAAVANQGTTMQFTATDPGTWACSGCAGSITSGGLYTAPATVTPQSSFGGYQVLPNNHIYNTRIDSLAVNASSAAWIAGAGVVPFSIKELVFPINYVDGSTPTQAMGFKFTTGNNDSFPIPAYPNAKIESGWLDRRNGNHDHHLFTIDQRNGTFREIYQPHTAIATTGASVSGNVATIIFASDPTALAGASLQVGDTAVTVYGFTGSDTYFNAAAVTITAATATSISFALTHANASASTNGFVSLGSCAACNAVSGVAYLNSTYGLPNNQGGSTDAAGLYLLPLELKLQEMEQAIAHATPIKHAFRMTLNQGLCASSFIWPATAFAADGGTVPFGARFRLKAAYDISGFSSAAQIILTALKNYGLILSDGGTGWATQTEAAAWPASIDSVFTEITNAMIAPSNFEAVDESALMISSTSGETTNNRETVTFTRTSDSTTASVDVALMGVTVGLPEDSKFIQAGTAAQQFVAYVHGGANNTVTWAMSPSIGTLTSGGLYTPPGTQAAVASTTVTATSTDNGAIAATMTVWIFPLGSIYIRPGASAPFTDSLGHVWAPSVTATSGGHLGCCGDLSGGGWPAVTDIAEYYYQFYPANDGYFNFSVPNGQYKITAKFGTASGTGQTIDTLERQGVVAYSNQDIFVTSGGNYKPVDFVIIASTFNGSLSFVVRHPAGLGTESSINAIQIDLLGPASGTTLTPGNKWTSGMTIR